MNNMLGMNIEQIRALSGQLDAASREVEQTMSSLTKALSVTEWVGNDRTRFDHDWSSMHLPGLREAAQALRQAAGAARQNADDQQRASGGR